MFFLELNKNKGNFIIKLLKFVIHNINYIKNVNLSYIKASIKIFIIYNLKQIQQKKTNF